MLIIAILFFVCITTSVTASENDADTKSAEVQLCIAGDIVESDCFKCVCDNSGFYHCVILNDICADQPNAVSQKPRTRSLCSPRMAYIVNGTTCICNEVGNWPHDRCEVLFKYLPNKTYKPCEPNTYVIKDCNVCKCNLNGQIDERHCTKNNCSEQPIQRRAINSVHGNCEPDSWYSLAACQFCYCVNANKLICSTGNFKAGKSVSLGDYNLTVCGKGLVQDILELIPEGQQMLRDGFKSSPPTTTETTLSPIQKKNYMTTVLYSSIAYESETQPNQVHSVEQEVNSSPLPRQPADNVEYEYESEEKNDTKPAPMVQRQGCTELPLPYQEGENTEPSAESHEAAESIKIADNTYIQPLEPLPELTTETHSHTPILKFDLPSVIDKLLRMALRKSNVKIDVNVNCIPGSSHQKGCNFCYCLTNGKMLCTDKKC